MSSEKTDPGRRVHHRFFVFSELDERKLSTQYNTPAGPAALHQEALDFPLNIFYSEQRN